MSEAVTLSFRTTRHVDRLICEMGQCLQDAGVVEKGGKSEYIIRAIRNQLRADAENQHKNQRAKE